MSCDSTLFGDEMGSEWKLLWIDVEARWDGVKAVEDSALISQFTAGVRAAIQQDVKRIALAYDGKTFASFRDEVLRLYKPRTYLPQRVSVREVSGEMVDDEPSLSVQLKQIKEGISDLSRRVTRQEQIGTEGRETQGPPQPGRKWAPRRQGRRSAGPTCFHCLEEGHVVRECEKYKQAKMAKKPSFKRVSSVPQAGRAGPERVERPVKNSQKPVNQSYNVKSEVHGKHKGIVLPSVSSDKPWESVENDDYKNFVTPSPRIDFLIYGKKLSAVVDTGAESSFLPYSVYKELLSGSISATPPSGFMRVFGANGIELQLYGCLRDVPIETGGVHILGNFLIGAENPAGHGDILIGCNILRKMEEASNDHDFKPRATWSRVFENVGSHVRQVNCRPLSWELRVNRNGISPHWIGPRQAKQIPCTLVGPELAGTDLIYWESHFLREVSYGSGTILVGIDEKGKPGAVMVQGGFLENPQVKEIAIWVVNTTREALPIWGGTLLADVSSAIGQEEVFCSPTKDGVSVSLRRVITCFSALDGNESSASKFTHNDDSQDKITDSNQGLAFNCLGTSTAGDDKDTSNILQVTNQLIPDNDLSLDGEDRTISGSIDQVGTTDKSDNIMDFSVRDPQTQVISLMVIVYCCRLNI